MGPLASPSTAHHPSSLFRSSRFPPTPPPPSCTIPPPSSGDPGSPPPPLQHHAPSLLPLQVIQVPAVCNLLADYTVSGERSGGASRPLVCVEEEQEEEGGCEKENPTGGRLRQEPFEMALQPGQQPPQGIAGEQLGATLEDHRTHMEALAGSRPTGQDWPPRSSAGALPPHSNKKFSATASMPDISLPTLSSWRSLGTAASGTMAPADSSSEDT